MPSDQLWTSSASGSRRTGTRLKELRNLFEIGITARAILEPLQTCTPSADAVTTRIALQDRQFDVAGVQNEPNGSVLGFVLREALITGTVADYLNPITTEHLISDTTALTDLIPIFKRRGWVFVLAKQHIMGIVTRADLTKPPMRMYLFGLVSLLEMHLTYWISKVYPDNTWTSQLSGGRLKDAEQLLSGRRQLGQDIDLIDCLQFCDKRDLILAHPTIRDTLCLGSKGHAQKGLRRAEALRNLLAHAQKDLTAGSDWEEVIGLVEWVETVVHVSDDLIESNS